MLIEFHIIATQLLNALASIVAVEAKGLQVASHEGVVVTVMGSYVVGHSGHRDLPCIGTLPAQWL
jgi:hypothetical protein